MINHFSLNYWVSLIVFVVHIIANLVVTKPNVELFTRLEKLTLFPPGWVFGIWFVIWTLQAILFYKSYGSAFWSNSMTVLFILLCIGNLGSQYAGANGLGWLVYILLIICMLVSAVLFMENASAFYTVFPISKAAAQLYVGWASLAFLVGSGVILVTDKKLVSDRSYTILGSVLLVIIPLVIWVLWFRDKKDYRIVTIPYFLLYFAFALRYLFR